MAEEEEQELDPSAEAKRIFSGYLNKLGWAAEQKRMIVNQLTPFAQKDEKLREGDELEFSADEYFGGEIDTLRHENSKTAKKILAEVLKLLEGRADLSFFGKRMRTRLKEEGYGLEHT